MERTPITKKGYDTLKKELEKLKSVDRPMNIRAIEDARSHGDLSENAEYEAAKDRQGFIEGRINELQYKLANAEIIVPETITLNGTAIFGCIVTLENMDTNEEVEYQLVGPDESDINERRISVISPLGKAIVGKRVGSEINIQVPGGRRNYEIVNISKQT